MQRRGGVIAAIATAAGKAGIGVVRLSGDKLESFAIALTGRRPAPRQAVLSRFFDADGSTIDRGILLYFRSPQSFTGEDVLELHAHGGQVVLQMLLARCVALGARIAEPGEFSQRAFLNGKLDLVQAEAIADLIDAGSVAAARSAVRSLSGDFSRDVGRLVQALVDLRALVEATLDFPDEEVDPLRDTDLVQRLAGIRADLGAILARARAGRMLQAGLHVVLAGLPNVGKSSLLNRLAGEERAIVTDVAGTTRDALRETIQIEGIPLHVIDTAGLRESEDIVERIGIERAWKEIGQADVVLQMIDARHGVTDADAAIAGQLPPGVERILVANKCDLAGTSARRSEDEGRVQIWLSAQTGEGVDLLHAELLRVAGWSGHGEDVVLARERHLEALRLAGTKLDLASGTLERLEVCAEELRLAQDALSRITGEVSADELLGEIFSRFCIGK